MGFRIVLSEQKYKLLNYSGVILTHFDHCNFFLQMAVWKENMSKFTYILYIYGQFCRLSQWIINDN